MVKSGNGYCAHKDLVYESAKIPKLTVHKTIAKSGNPKPIPINSEYTNHLLIQSWRETKKDGSAKQLWQLPQKVPGMSKRKG